VTLLLKYDFKKLESQTKDCFTFYVMRLENKNTILCYVMLYYVTH